jgi:hypothetical protein
MGSVSEVYRIIIETVIHVCSYVKTRTLTNIIIFEENAKRLKSIPGNGGEG